jgi:uncharacterized membrane protein
MVSCIGHGRVIVAFATIYAIWGVDLSRARASAAVAAAVPAGRRSLDCRRAHPVRDRAVAKRRIAPGRCLDAGGARRPSAVRWLSRLACLCATIRAVGPRRGDDCDGPVLVRLAQRRHAAQPSSEIGNLLAPIPGLSGVALIAWRRVSPKSSSVDPTMVLLLLASAFSWAAGSLVGQRRATGVSATALAGMQLLCGGAVLLAASGLVGEWKEFALGGVSPVSWAGFAYLTLAGSVTAYTAYVWLLDRVPGSLVTTYTFITPIIAVFLGWTFLGERLNAQMLLGTTLVIGSVILVWRLETVSDISIAQRKGRPTAMRRDNCIRG